MNELLAFSVGFALCMIIWMWKDWLTTRRLRNIDSWIYKKFKSYLYKSLGG